MMSWKSLSQSILKSHITSVSKRSCRSIHTVPTLANDSLWTNKGIPQLLTSQGYKLAWNDYQSYCATQLSLLTVGTDLEHQTPFQIMLTTQGLAHQASIFHYASQLHNNHFFFSALVNDPNTNTSVPNRELVRKIESTFQSFEQFKKEFLAKAESLNGNGWVYLIENADKGLEIRVFNNEGSPYFYNRNQDVNLSSPINLAEYEKLQKYQSNLNSKVKDWSLPLLGVSVWDYTYVYDYGADKKKEYLENVWKAINWDVVNKRVFVLN
ncbi:mitochondrial 37S ribosomal protein [Saccharomycopsis crataegensis]|uniref:Mitochondrial 37S ribosomal protein n=1 Tax=Saccharomycopsis crataegensis TaxID=43959 RepID=A0AAV5QLG4_9ASCO|nr:mitochondrial 37S ribosomal protein [Saccharomycopsis crataegensis]